MLKMSLLPASALPAIAVDDSEVVGSSNGNEKKLAKSDFTKPMRKAEKLSFLILNARRAFT